MTTNVYWSSCKLPVILLDLNETLNSQQIFGKYSNIKFHENMFGGRRVVPWDR